MFLQYIYVCIFLFRVLLVDNLSCLSSKDDIMTQKDGQKAKVEVHRSVGDIDIK